MLTSEASLDRHRANRARNRGGHCDGSLEDSSATQRNKSEFRSEDQPGDWLTTWLGARGVRFRGLMAGPINLDGTDVPRPVAVVSFSGRAVLRRGDYEPLAQKEKMCPIVSTGRRDLARQVVMSQDIPDSSASGHL